MATSERPFGAGNFMALVIRVVEHEFNSVPLETCGETVKSLVGCVRACLCKKETNVFMYVVSRRTVFDAPECL